MNQLAASLHLSGEWSYEAGREYHVQNTMFLKKSTSISPTNIFNRKNVKLEFFFVSKYHYLPPGGSLLCANLPQQELCLPVILMGIDH